MFWKKKATVERLSEEVDRVTKRCRELEVYVRQLELDLKINSEMLIRKNNELSQVTSFPSCLDLDDLVGFLLCDEELESDLYQVDTSIVRKILQRVVGHIRSEANPRKDRRSVSDLPHRDTSYIKPISPVPPEASPSDSVSD